MVLTGRTVADLERVAAEFGNDPPLIPADVRSAGGGTRALMIELLAGALVGDLFSFEASDIDPGDGGPPRGGELVLAIDPAKLSVGGDPVRHAEALFARILEQEGARLPSDRRYAARLRTPTEGITIPRSLHDTIQRLRSG